MLLVFVAGTLGVTRIGRNDSTPWNLTDRETHGGSYKEVAKRDIGRGVFRMPEGDSRSLGSVYLATHEIGIVSYFAGADVWLYDLGGLAQAGQLSGVRAHWRPVARHPAGACGGRLPLGGAGALGARRAPGLSA